MIESIVAPVRSLFAGGTSGGKAALPGGLTVDKWIAEVEAQRGADYAGLVAHLVAHLRGHGRADTVAQLRRVFPNTSDRMVPVVLPVLPKLVGELAHVFGGDGEKFEIVGPESVGEDGEPVETLVDAAGGVSWAKVLDEAGLVAKLKEANRLTTAIRRTFVRVTWDERAQRVVLALFTPDAVFPRFQPDSYDLDRAHGVLLRLADGWVDGKPVKRWEWWSAGEKPDNFIVDEKGNVSRPADSKGNPYQDDAGEPIVPIVSFGDADTDAGYWLRPREDWLEQQRAVNVDETSVRHVARTTGFGVFTAQAESMNTAEEWPDENTLSPDEVFPVPKGWTLQNIAAQADLAGLEASLAGFVRTITSLNNLPPGSVLAEGRQVPSGVALQIERAPLDETRATQVDVYRASVVRLLDVIRAVWNAHNPKARFVGRSRWTPGAVKPPEDPEQKRRTEQQDINMGVASPVTILMAREKLSREEAEERIAEIAADNRERQTLAGLGARLMSGSPLPSAPPPGPLAQSRAKAQGDEDEGDDE